MVESKKRWLNPSELEAEYGIKRNTQSKMRMRSAKIKIPFSKIGSKIVRYDRHKLDEWLENNAVEVGHEQIQRD